jgi:hypothetical protein
MKDDFTSIIKGHKFEFNRVAYSSFDVWYHVTASLNKVEVRFRMKEVCTGAWEIKTPRILNIRTYETACSEAIKENERTYISSFTQYFSSE